MLDCQLGPAPASRLSTLIASIIFLKKFTTGKNILLIMNAISNQIIQWEMLKLKYYFDEIFLFSI